MKLKQKKQIKLLESAIEEFKSNKAKSDKRLLLMEAEVKKLRQQVEQPFIIPKHTHPEYSMEKYVEDLERLRQVTVENVITQVLKKIPKPIISKHIVGGSMKKHGNEYHKPTAFEQEGLCLLINGSNSMEGDLELEKTAYYDAEFNNGSKNDDFTLDWNNGNKQRVALANDVTITFTNPKGACNLVFKVIQDGTGTRLVTWDADVRWSEDTPPTLSTGAGDIDILTFYFDGMKYYGAFIGDFV